MGIPCPRRDAELRSAAAPGAADQELLEALSRAREEREAPGVPVEGELPRSRLEMRWKWLLNH